eukprot:3863796-Prorocentrum_lima.AAC.1
MECTQLMLVIGGCFNTRPGISRLNLVSEAAASRTESGLAQGVETSTTAQRTTSIGSSCSFFQS